MSEQLIRVLIVDDHPVVRDGLKLMLSVTPGFLCVGQAENGLEAIRFCSEIKPDVVLMDLMMPQMDGATATQHIRKQYPDIKVIVLTSFDEKDLVQKALRAGAISYVMKNSTMETLTDAIRNAYHSRSTLAPEALQALVAIENEEQFEPELTPREQEILKLMFEGRTNVAIAEKLYISEATARFHVSNILTKLGANNRTEAVRIALDRKLVST